ncbi:glycosyltransferase [Patulibacter defluvii]|uniref:glycosyltransferase n=1 Tax=Patulibacter defluvii TaxID=3095358 RepID=UPI002A755A9E|nr:glycosyltransferase family 2 protein [Patulibacter sp. DM4]
MPADPVVSVVISARDGAATVDRAVAAVLAQRDAPAYELVLVDNASRDDTGARAAASGDPRVRVLRLDDRGAGPGVARNHGVREARGALIAFTDIDCYPTPDWLAGLVAAARDADLVAGPIEPDPGERRAWERTLRVAADQGLYPTANLLVRREDFLAAGGFRDWHDDGSPTEEAPARPFGEDTRMAWGLLRRGARAGWAADALVHHAVLPEDPRGWLRRRWEMHQLPDLVRQVPELRRTLLTGGLFVDRRTATSAAAGAGLALAAVSRRRAPLLLALPHGLRVARDLRAAGPLHVAVALAGDAVQTAALVVGSVRHRTPVL